MKRGITWACLALLALATASAQAPSTGPDEIVGTIVEFAPGSSIALKPDAGDAVRYSFSKTVTIVNANGKEIPLYKLKRDRKVRLHLVKAGTQMSVDKVTLVQD